MGKSPPGSERVRIGTAMLSIDAGGHCALSVIARFDAARHVLNPAGILGRSGGGRHRHSQKG
jgi:hypothetical protein